MNAHRNVATRFSLLLILIVNLFGARLPATFAAQPISPVESQPDAEISSPQAVGAIRTVILYNEDSTGAQAIADLLNLNNFDADTFQILKYFSHSIFLPVIMRGAQVALTGRIPVPNTSHALPDFSAYDLILVMADTGNDGYWSMEPGLVTAIEDSGLPVAGLGSGGHALFGKLGLEIGYPYGVSGSGHTVQVTDFGASQAFYLDPNTITIPTTERLKLFTTTRTVLNIPLADPLPDGIRVASLVGTATQYPIVVAHDRFLLWGFDSSNPHL